MAGMGAYAILRLRISARSVPLTTPLHQRGRLSEAIGLISSSDLPVARYAPRRPVSGSGRALLEPPGLSTSAEVIGRRVRGGGEGARGALAGYMAVSYGEPLKCGAPAI